MAERKGHERVEELARLPSEREGRTGRSLRQAMLLSLLLHAIFLVLAYLVGKRVPLPDALRPPEPPAFDSIPVEFTDQRVKVPAPEPPDTNVVGTQDAEASSPGPGEPVPHGETSHPDPDLGRRGPPEPEEREPQDAAREPEPAREAAQADDPAPVPAEESIEDKRRRVAEALGRIGARGGDGGEGDVTGWPSSGIGFSFGGGSMQIESRSDVDWGPWAERVQREVKENWYQIMPVAARVGMKGIVVVRFRVQRDGTITDFETMESAGVPPLDRAVNDALLVMSSPLPPLPLPEDSDEESIRITYTFIYNLEDDREIRAWRRMNWQRQKAEQGG